MGSNEKQQADRVVSMNVQAPQTSDALKQVDVSVYFKHLEAKKTTTDSKFMVIRYPISIYLGEAVGSHKGKASVPFSIEVKTDPDVATFTLKGEAYVQGLPEEIESMVIPKGGKAPRIWVMIYREAVAMLTILSKFIDVPPPPVPSSE